MEVERPRVNLGAFVVLDHASKVRKDDLFGKPHSRNVITWMAARDGCLPITPASRAHCDGFAKPLGACRRRTLNGTRLTLLCGSAFLLRKHLARTNKKGFK